MSKDTDWREDSEAMNIAIKITDKFPNVFEGLDLAKIRFIRKLSGTSKRVGELKACAFPYDIDCPYAYYIIVENSKWKEMSESQQVLSIMHLLYGIAPGGTDESSSNYAKCRRHDVKDFNVVLAAAGGRYDWSTTGISDLINPLGCNEDELMAKIEQ